MIKITSVNFPKDLYNSFKENNVVVFAGAGVSMGKPSGLPSFSKLADDIAECFGEKPMCRDKRDPLYRPIDLFLDELSPNNKMAINKRAAEILNDRYKKPNDLHMNIIKLFKDTKNIRIVTTNFDRLFTKAFHKVYEKNAKLKIYSNPALPLGGNFNGIVHLHGSLADPEHMVLTRTHFGRAYLTDGGVRRFLLPLFQKYTVLFIGYSLDDVVMDYLQRALPHETMQKRYILTGSKADESNKWKSLGVEPIRFEITKEKENDYSNLYDLVDKLANRLNRNLIDWENKLSSHCSKKPQSLDAEAVGEVIEALENRDIVTTFIQVNNNTDWIQWVYERGMLDNLFKETQLNKIDRILGIWLSNFSNTHPELLVGLLIKTNYHMNSWFWHQLLWMMGKDVDVKNVTQFSILLQILLNHAPTRKNPYGLLRTVTLKCKRLNHSFGLYQILSFMLSHTTYLEENWSFTSSDVKEEKISYRISHDIPGFSGDLLAIWDECFLNNNELDKEIIFQILLNKFNALGIALSDKDSIRFTYRRKAIEKNIDKYKRDPLGDLVDFIRAYMSDLDQTDSELFSRKLVLLLESPFSLLRRIAIDSLRLTKRIKPKEKFDLVLSKVEIDDLVYKNELFLFVKDNFSYLSSSEQNDFVKLIEETYKSKYDTKDKEEHYYWAIFNWLEWLDRRPYESGYLKDLLLKIEEKYPDWTPRKEPQYSFSPVEIIDAFNSPLTEKQFETIPDEKFIDYMVNFNENSPNVPNRFSMLSVLQSVASKNPNWGIEKIILLNRFYPYLDDIFERILNGIVDSNKRNLNTERLLKCVPVNVYIEKFPKQFLDVFIELLKLKKPSLSINIVNIVDNVVERIWETIKNEKLVISNSNWFIISRNSISGKVVEYWIRRLNIKTDKNNEQVIKGIEKYKSRFIEIINGNSSQAKLARPFLCLSMNYLYSHDSEWVKNNLIPLFESADDDVFRQAWEGFLHTASLSPELVATLHDSFRKALKRVDVLHDSMRPKFAEFYASIVVHNTNNPISEWINPLLRVENNELTIEFAKQLCQTIRDIDSKERQSLWNQWYKVYLENRKDNIPVIQLEDEVCSYLDGVLDFDFAFREIIDLVIQFNGINLEHSDLLHNLIDDEKWLSYVDEVTDLLIYLADCDVESWHETDFKKIITKFNIRDSEKFPILDNKLRKHGIFIKEIS